jgi:hypothetical protein
MPPEYGDEPVWTEADDAAAATIERLPEVLGAQLPADYEPAAEADDLRGLDARGHAWVPPPSPAELSLREARAELVAQALRIARLESIVGELVARHPRHTPPPGLGLRR